MKKKSIRELIFLLSFILGSFSSCENEDAEYWLCNSVWLDIFDYAPHTVCYQDLPFNPDGTGVDHREYYYFDAPDGVEIYAFYWKWNPKHSHSIIMDYPDGRSYFNNVWVDRYTLKGDLDGVSVTFEAAK